jgi:large subunit ribosomal protein L15
MELNQLADNQGARKSRMRVGRGVGSGKGKTAGRGYKGQKSREGVAVNGFEGGQMPIHRRLPKRGFSNPFRREVETVNLRDIARAIEAKTLDAAKPINAETLAKAGLVRGKAQQVKLLATGELKSKVTIEVSLASAAAIEKVKKAGGNVTVTAPAAKAE